jgi:hypothetical protein
MMASWALWVALVAGGAAGQIAWQQGTMSRAALLPIGAALGNSGKVLVFGGSTGAAAVNDLTWVDIVAGTVSAGVDAGRSVRNSALVFDEANDTAWVICGGAPGSETNDMMPLHNASDASSWGWGATVKAQATRRNHVAELSPTHRLVFIFAGKLGSSFYSNNLEVRDAANNMALASVSVTGTAPSGRMFMASAFDPVGERMFVLTGNTGVNVNSPEVWTLVVDSRTAAHWVQVGSTPVSRNDPAAFYQRETNQLWMVQGDSGLSSAVRYATVYRSSAVDTTNATKAAAVSWTRFQDVPYVASEVAYGGSFYNGNTSFVSCGGWVPGGTGITDQCLFTRGVSIPEVFTTATTGSTTATTGSTTATTGSGTTATTGTTTGTPATTGATTGASSATTTTGRTSSSGRLLAWSTEAAVAVAMIVAF